MGSRSLRFEGPLWRAELPRRHDNAPGLAEALPLMCCEIAAWQSRRWFVCHELEIPRFCFPTHCVDFFFPPRYAAQDTDKEVDDAIQQATEVAKKMGVKMPDVKKQLEEVNKEEAKEKAALQKQLETPGPLALPDWTPKVPQFEPTGPVSRKIVSDEVNIIQTATSPLTPAELGEIAGKKQRKVNKLNSSRTNGSYNDIKVVTIYLSTRQEPVHD